MSVPPPQNSYVALRNDSALAISRRSVSTGIIVQMAVETLATIQGTSLRPFKIVLCGVLSSGLNEAVEQVFRLSISKFRPGPVTFEILTAQTAAELYADLEVRSVDMIIFLNVMSFGGGSGRRNADPKELLADIFERTHKPIIAMSGHPELNRKLRHSTGFVIIDMPFQLKEVEAICENLLRQNGYLLK
jgi:hypothetical protein